MKKLFSTLCMAALTAIAFSVNAQVWLVGEGFNGWTTDNNTEMTVEDGDSIYTWTGELSAGNHFAFFLNAQAWGNQRGPAAGNNSAPTGDWEDTQAGGSWLLTKSGTYEIQYNYMTNQAKIAINEEAPINPAQRKFAVTGAAFGGWNMPPAGNQTFANNGDGTYTLEFEGAVAGDFKLAGVGINDAFDAGWSVFNSGAMGAANLVEGDNALSTSFGTGNMTFPVNGNVVLTISNVTETSCTLNIALKQEVVPDKAWYLAGSFTDWGTGKLPMTKNEDGTYSVTVSEVANGAQFKLVNELDQWFGGVTEDGTPYPVSPDSSTGIEMSTNGSNFEINGSGNLTFTIGTDNKLTITGWTEVQPLDPAMYIIGSFNEWNEETQEALTAGENNTWTITKALEAGATFKFRDENGSWYGGIDENEVGYFEISKDLVNDATPISLTDGANFMIPVAGEWTFTITRSAEAMTLVVSGTWPVEGKVGDLNNDGNVDIEDVNDIINIILELKTQDDYPGNANINGDEKIDVEDMNAIINIILTSE